MKKSLIAVLLLLFGFAFSQTDKFNYLHYIENGHVPKNITPRIGFYYWNYTSDEYFDTDGDRNDYVEYTQNWIMTTFALGLGDVLELGVAVPYLLEHAEGYSIWGVSITDEMNGDGIGDINVWAKAQISKVPNFGLRAALKTASGEEAPDEGKLPTGSGQSDLDMGFQLAYVPPKLGFMCDANISYRLRMEMDSPNIIYDKFNPGDEGRMGVYIGGMPVEGVGFLFGWDGIVSFNDQYDNTEYEDSWRASAMIGLKGFYKSKFGLKVETGFKLDVAGKNSSAGTGWYLGSSYEPKFN